MRVFTEYRRGVAIRAAGPEAAPTHVWFHPAFGDAMSSYREALQSRLTRLARVFVYDPPGHGASAPARGTTTIEGLARLWYRLVGHFSRSRQVVLVGHSLAGVIACRAATWLSPPPVLVIGVESNLTRSDAFLTGQAARHSDAAAFHEAVRAQLRQRANAGAAVRRFARNFERADPATLWKLGRAVAGIRDPGAGFRRLRCPGIYYWDSACASAETQAYVARYRLRHRRLDHLGHWPMLAAPDVFYAAIEEDILAQRRHPSTRDGQCDR